AAPSANDLDRGYDRPAGAAEAGRLLCPAARAFGGRLVAGRRGLRRGIALPSRRPATRDRTLCGLPWRRWPGGGTRKPAAGGSACAISRGAAERLALGPALRR